MTIGSDVYRKAPGNHNPREIMAEYSSKPDASDGHMFATVKLKDDFTKTNPFSMEKEQGFISSLTDGNTQKRTVLQTIMPNKSYGVDSINADAMKRSVEGFVGGGAQLQKQVATMQADVKKQMSEIRQDVKQAQCEAIDAVKCAAKDNPDIDRDVAVDAVSSPRESSKLTAGVAIAGEIGMGAGTLATFLKTVYSGNELSKEDKKLSPKEKEALLNDTLARLQSSGTNETVMEANSAATVKFDVPAQSKFDWNGMDVKDLERLLEADIDKLPEMQELDNSYAALSDVNDNHGYLDNRQDIDFKDELPEVDAVGVELTGLSLREFRETKGVTAQNNPYFEAAGVSDISEKLKHLQPEDDELVYKPPQNVLSSVMSI